MKNTYLEEVTINNDNNIPILVFDVNKKSDKIYNYTFIGWDKTILPATSDLIYTASYKKEYIEYFELVDKMLEDKGIILADNILSHYEKVQDYTVALFNNKNYPPPIRTNVC